jgi:formylglycine-generating enzyme required for sulfatase activity
LAGQVLVEAAIFGRPSSRNKVTLDRVKTGLLHILEGEDLPALERVNAGNALAGLGDPRFDKECWHLPNDGMLGFVRIPAGSFSMGSDRKKDPEARDNELPQHDVYLSEYWMGRYPVTVAQYRAFLDDTQQKPTSGWERWNRIFNHPVVSVSWEDASAYCIWLTGKLKHMENLPGDLKKIGQTHGLKVCLPTEAQ